MLHQSMQSKLRKTAVQHPNKMRNLKMLKEKYIAPETDAVEIKEIDVITTSPIAPTFGDELNGIDKSYFDENDPLYGLF